jgi:CubicO group peptidase (beta-lactamase class C family)
MGWDSLKLSQAVRFMQDHETTMPRNLELAQVLNFGKEPFSDGVGPFAERKASSGLIVYKGYIISSWGDIDYPEQTNSISKSYLSAVVGLAVKKGLIANVNDLVHPYLPMVEPADAETYRNPEALGTPQFLTPFLSTHNRKITWEHLLRQTSDWEGSLWGKPDWADRPEGDPSTWLTRKRNEPGTVWKYNDTRVNALALATTLVFRRPLPEVLKEEIMDPIGASNQWHWTGYRNSWIVLDGKKIQSVSGGGHFGGGMFISAQDMARFGLLGLRNGKWKDRQLIEESWLKNSMTPTTANKGYGYMNYFLNTDKKLLPSAPTSCYVHIGNGTNMVYVDKEHDLVVVARWIENNAMDQFIRLVLEARK